MLSTSQPLYRHIFRCNMLQVCDKDAVQARISDASAWLSSKKRCIGYKRFMMLKFSLRDSSSGHGITRVSLFVKKDVASFLYKYRYGSSPDW